MRKIADIYADSGIVIRSKVPQVHFVLILLLSSLLALVIQSLFQGNYIQAVFIGIALIIMAVSLWMLYRGNYRFSSIAPLAVIIFLVVAVSIDLEPESRYQIYLIAFFVTFPLVLSLTISESEWYIVIVAAIGLPTILLISFMKIMPVVLVTQNAKDFSLALITSSVLYLLLSCFSILISHSNRLIMENVEESSKNATGTLGEIVRISSNAQSSLNTSKSVESDYAHVQESVEQIRSQLGVLEQSITNLRENMKNALESISSTTDRVSEFDGQVDDQNSVVLESTAAVNEMSASLDSVAEITKKKKNSSEMLLNVVNEGLNSLDETTVSFNAAKNEMSSLVEINSIISGVADQTNLLSMNAAIEAAHAGEAGKGFAVVAEEIRKLASSTADNSLTISNSLKRIMDSISSTGVNVDQTSGSMKKISGEVEEVTKAFEEITGATAELSISGHEIMSAMQMLQNSSVVVREGSIQISNDQQKVRKEMDHIGNVTEAIENASNEVTSSIAMIDKSLEHLQGTITESMSQSVQLHGSINSLVDGLN